MIPKHNFIILLQNNTSYKTIIFVKLGLHMKIIACLIWYLKNCWIISSVPLNHITPCKPHSIYQAVQGVLRRMEFSIKHKVWSLLAFAQALLSICLHDIVPNHLCFLRYCMVNTGKSSQIAVHSKGPITCYLIFKLA